MISKKVLKGYVRPLKRLLPVGRFRMTLPNKFYMYNDKYLKALVAFVPGCFRLLCQVFGSFNTGLQFIHHISIMLTIGSNPLAIGL